MSAFANRVALITGAGSGIGRQLALILASEGATIAAVDLNADALATLAKELPGKSYGWETGDVTDRAGLGAAVERLQQRLGPIDLLIANAGIGRETSGFRFNAEDFEAQIRVNLIGVANSIETVLPTMLARQRGHLVGMSSLASYRGFPKMAGYCASKSGLNGLLDTLRVELKPLGIDVTTVCPGWIRTPLTENIGIPHEIMLDVDDAARRIVTAIRRRKSFLAFPRVALWHARLCRILPYEVSDWMVRTLMRRALLQRLDSAMRPDAQKPLQDKAAPLQ